MSLLTLIVAAFITGILGSIHCMSMCGGIACSVGYLDKQPTAEQPIHFAGDDKQRGSDAALLSAEFVNALKFNFGRLCSYSILGAFFAYVGHHIINLNDTSTLLSAFRYFSASLIALIGFKYLFGLKLIDMLEKAGFRLWNQVKTSLKVNRYLSSSSVVALGMVWGLLPCGLIYTMLISASSAGTAWGGALIMFAFGLGTLPAMLSISSISRTIKDTKNNLWLKRVFGCALILLAVLLVFLEMNAACDDMCLSFIETNKP